MSEKLIIVIWILFGFYSLVFLSILADLWAGVRKARLRGELRTSYGLRRTVTKLSKSYNALVALTIIDAMQMTGIWYLITYNGCSCIYFPVFTFIGALFIALIELKSICEKADVKKIRDVTELLGSIVHDKKDARKIAETIAKYLTEKNKEKDA